MTVDMLSGRSGTIRLRNGKTFYAHFVEPDQDRPGCFNFRMMPEGPNFYVNRDGTNYFPPCYPSDRLWEVIEFIPDLRASAEDIAHYESLHQ